MDNYIAAKNEREAKWQSLVNSFEHTAKTLEDKWKELEEGHKALEAQKADLARQNGGANVSDSDTLDINAGGQIVRVSRGTLTQVKGSRLEALFSGRWEKQLLRDSQGRIFLDVNPTCFKCIVDYLNECTISPLENPPNLPRTDTENQVFLDALLTAFGLDGMDKTLDSTILTDLSHVRALQRYLSEADMGAGLDLLYRGSRDGLNARSFHQKCNNQGPTVTVVKSTESYIFGGFSDLPWTSQNTQYIQSNRAFLFGLHCHGSNQPIKLPLKGNFNGNAIYRHSTHGPTFGVGYDLRLWGGGCCHYLGSTYALPPGWTSSAFFTGENSFALSDIEVFRVCSSSQRAPPQPDSSQPWQNPILKAFPEEIQKSFKAEVEALLGASNELSMLQDLFAKEQAAVQAFCPMNENDIALLNVSGQSMAVKHATLATYPESVLYKQLVDPNWNTHSAGNKPRLPHEWSAEQVYDWSKKIPGLSRDVSSYFRDVTGTELLALGREDVKDLLTDGGKDTKGQHVVGTVALLMKAIEKLRNENNETLIGQSDYCFGKIIDHMRLKAMRELDVPDSGPPEIREPDKRRFKAIVEYYFPKNTSEFLA
jgi:hypothetical protein